MRYKFIEFIKQEKRPGAKTSAWVCKSKGGEMIGIVKWYTPWKLYCYHPMNSSFYDSTCLCDIQDFLKAMTYANRENEKKGG